jgi:hypothetical protein
MRALIPAVLSGAVGGPALAADVTVTIDIPRLNVAEYHRPYVAVWLERTDQPGVANLAVWYDLKLKDGEGTKWLKDMRQWWRRTGRELQLPVDGLSGATRAPGEHRLAFAGDKSPLSALPAGQYQLVVEAAREVGGRELVRLPLQWPPAQPTTQKVAGEHELGAVTLNVKP